MSQTRNGPRAQGGLQDWWGQQGREVGENANWRVRAAVGGLKCPELPTVPMREGSQGSQGVEVTDNLDTKMRTPSEFSLRGLGTSIYQSCSLGRRGVAPARTLPNPAHTLHQGKSIPRVLGGRARQQREVVDLTISQGSTVGQRLDFEGALCQQVSSWPLPKPTLHLSRPKATLLCVYLHTLVCACTQARFRISRPSHSC